LTKLIIQGRIFYIFRTILLDGCDYGQLFKLLNQKGREGQLKKITGWNFSMPTGVGFDPKRSDQLYTRTRTPEGEPHPIH
jgi:hypothetical protein